MAGVSCGVAACPLFANGFLRIVSSCCLTCALVLQMEQLANMEGSGLIPLLTDSKYEDLSRMYNLFKRVDGGLDLLRKMMGDHITAQGLALVTDPEKVRGGGAEGLASGVMGTLSWHSG